MRIGDKSFWKDFLDGVQRALGPTDSVERAALDTLRMRLDKPSTARRHKKFEEELDELLRTNPVMKLATDRYLRKKVPVVIAAAEATLKRAQHVLEKSKRMKREWVN